MSSNDAPRPGESIGDRQARIEAALRALGELLARHELPRELDALEHLAPRPGTAARVVLHYEDQASPSRLGRDIKDDAAADHWSPKPGRVARVFYVDDPSAREPERASLVREAADLRESAPTRPAVSTEIRELLRELDRAERSGMPYIVLKWFRDTCLVSSRLSWVGTKDDPVSAAIRQRVLAESIERGLVTTRKVPNPKQPEKPSTAIGLARAHPDVVDVLERPESLPEFRPVPIQGESLSDMIIRERREQ